MVALGIADDEPDIRRLFKMVLDSKGYHIAYMATDGNEAVEMNRIVPADVIFMDYVMPFKDGLEASKEILAERPQTKILLMTCGEDVEEHIKGMDNVAIMKKPFPLKSILTVLHG